MAFAASLQIMRGVSGVGLSVLETFVCEPAAETQPKPAAIVLLEDDSIQQAAIKVWLQEAFPKASIQLFSNESSFCAWLETETTAPDLAILDVMVRWSDPGSERPEEPEDVQQEGSALAGIRCAMRLRQIPLKAKVPVIFYTVFNREDFVSDIGKLGLLLTKSSDPKPLIEAARRLISQPKPAATEAGLTRGPNGLLAGWKLPNNETH